MDAAAREACAVYEQVWKDKLEAMSQARSPIYTVSAEAFAARTFDFEGFGDAGYVLMAWTLARMRAAEGNREDARAFARLAAEDIGDVAGAGNLRGDILKFLESL